MPQEGMTGKFKELTLIKKYIKEFVKNEYNYS